MSDMNEMSTPMPCPSFVDPDADKIDEHGQPVEERPDAAGWARQRIADVAAVFPEQWADPQRRDALIRLFGLHPQWSQELD